MTNAEITEATLLTNDAGGAPFVLAELRSFFEGEFPGSTQNDIENAVEHALATGTVWPISDGACEDCRIMVVA